MKTLDLANALDIALKDLRLLDHPWYKRWTNGELSREELRDYAEQYLHFEAALPGLLTKVAEALPSGSAKDLVLENLYDELGNGAISHVELFGKYIDVLGGDHNASVSPAMQNLVADYEDLVSAGPVEGLGGIMAYEIQAAEIASSKGSGLKANYGMTADQTTFWDLHATLDVDHGEWSMESMAALVDEPTNVVSSTRKTAEAWWNFLNERESLHSA